MLVSSHSEMVDFPLSSVYHMKNSEILASAKDQTYFNGVLKVSPRLPLGRILVAGDDKVILHN